MRRWDFALTFEQPMTRPPETVRGVVEAGSLQMAASNAVRVAKRAKPGQRYDSVVILLERAAPPTGETPSAA